jgi:hypothetical protein
MKFFNPMALIILLVPISFSINAKEGYDHLPAIFIGATHVEGETDFTYALEYEYKFTDDYGVGIIYEKVDDAHHGDGITLKLAALYYHPISSVRLGLGLGKEKLGGDHPHTEDVVRLSASYDYHFEHFSVAPTIALDFIDGETPLVFGIAVIKPF